MNVSNRLVSMGDGSKVRLNQRAGIRPSVWFKRALAAGVVAYFVGCVAPEDESGSPGNETQQSVSGVQSNLFDVNDLSILYPLNSRFSSRPGGELIRLTDGRGLLSEQVFRTILDTFRRDFKQDFSSGSQSEFMNELSKWAVVGLRLDHCFRANFSDPCSEQVRLVAQPVPEGDVTTADFALHLVYQPSASVATILQDIIRVRQNYARPENRQAVIGKPLSVHPILKKEGLDSEFAQALRNEVILKHLDTSALRGIATSFIEPNRLQPWVFFATDARDFSVIRGQSIFMFDPGTTVNDCGVQRGRMVCRRDLRTGAIVDSEEMQAGVTEASGVRAFTADGRPFIDQFLQKTLTDPDGRTFSSVKKDEARWRQIFNRIENPKLTALAMTNCTSCHRTLTERVRFDPILDLSPTGPDGFVVDPSSGCTPGIGIDYRKEGLRTINVRMFGYFENDAVISQRTVNETLEVCEHFKKAL
jgi:hypothetical protein